MVIGDSQVGLGCLSQRNRGTPLTDEMMSLRALVEKASDADILREMLAFGAKRLMELEVARRRCAAASGQSSTILRPL